MLENKNMSYASESHARDNIEIDELKTRIVILQERIDLNIDEFQRIKNAIHDDATGLHGERAQIIAEEVVGLCDRAIAAGRQRVPLIVQRDRAENKNVKLRELLYRALELTKDIATDEAGEWTVQVREALGEVER